jgi:hypothetical protein
MAFLDFNYCFKCEKETQHINGNCLFCCERLDRERIAKWNAQTIDEKLSNLRKRIEELERGPMRF